MSTHQQPRWLIAIRKFFLSAFVILTFFAYVIHERLTNPAETQDSADAASPTLSNNANEVPISHSADAVISVAKPTETAIPAQGNDSPPAADPPTPQPVTPLPKETATLAGLYKDGTYTGNEADAYFGMVQVEAVIQNGKLTQVNVLEYPDHRRTSVRINQQALPLLQQEAIQLQSAQIDLISGATLTCEAFAQSLQSALDAARN